MKGYHREEGDREDCHREEGGREDHPREEGGREDHPREEGTVTGRRMPGRMVKGARRMKRF